MKTKKIGNWVKPTTKTSEEFFLNTDKGRSLKLVDTLLSDKTAEGKEKALEILNDMGFNVTDSTLFKIVFRKNVIRICDEYFQICSVYLQID